MAQVNGDFSGSSPSSVFLQHLLDYPVVYDGVSTFKQNPYGQKSLQLSDSAYKTFAQPLAPFLNKPFQFVRPYLQKADSLGDQALSKVEETAPFVKKPTRQLVADARALVGFPYRTGLEAKDHVLNTYSAECKKAGGDGIVAHSKALVSTALISSSELLGWASTIMHRRGTEAKETVKEKANH
ncbi:hypothetical protein SODALDRAFT_319852 [Sodiomyces alkalinus F11]|uniref:CAP20 n=1 Tax=Sodiomyces alkalinus (strain CBS 110278 / VKM F-3762 / F11) TaxID=1314773 RepID=A0A3N2Q9P5_SODAK|nr:hypothetical protein SODALDRAFT_319852 [Sodiomyces alkalinus F11]ROT43378.1 hypothetical protein SODALDRAFT_319852 [Sodiomyces alkalinus F11]